MESAQIATVTMKTHRPLEVARFWRDLLGYQVAPNHSDSILLVSPGEPALLIQPSEHPVPGGAIHLDLRPSHQASLVERALALGAHHIDIGQTGDEGWIVLADPGGHAFCVLQSAEALAESLAEDSGSPSSIDD